MEIRHYAAIRKIGKGKVLVEISDGSHDCANCGCRAKCGGTGDEGLLEVAIKPGRAFRKGQKVVVRVLENAGFQVVLLAYVYPLGILMTALFWTYYFVGSELEASGLGLLAAGAYYLGLYRLREKVKKKFAIWIE